MINMITLFCYSVHEDLTEAIYGILQSGISHPSTQGPSHEEGQRSALRVTVTSSVEVI